MINSKVLFKDFITQLTLKESSDEIRSMAELVFEKVLGLSRMSILSEKELSITVDQKKSLDEIALRLNSYEPLQYIIGEAMFYGRMFFVTPSVLIPRPETEELVNTIINSVDTKAPLQILDIGTGSGCIPITLALELQGSKVYATDISEAALQVAAQNASTLAANVNFIRHDILNEDLSFTSFDVITSNPPYIALEEKGAMGKNVVAYEPHLALFVSDNDPLIFYAAIASKAKHALKPGGFLVVEINERFGKEVIQLFLNNNFSDVTIIKDLSGKDRIVKGTVKTINP